MTVEEYVCEMWLIVETYPVPNGPQIIINGNHRDYLIGWSTARQFTEQRIEEVRQLQEEIDSITGDVELCASIPHPSEEAIYRRILARLEELLAAKSAGLSAKALEGK